MQLSDFHYDLPETLIARYPLPERSASRLLVLNGKTGAIWHQSFCDLADLLNPGDLLVCNDSRVIKARLFGKKDTGGQVEILVERVLDSQRILAHVRASKSPRPHTFLQVRDVRFEMLQRHADLFELFCHDARHVLTVIAALGEIPLPPYFQRAPEAIDEERYQTIYAKQDGSVAAPTAGLHFDEKIFKKLHEKGIEIDYVTLHVGAGTFLPVRVANITEHRMHPETIVVSEALCKRIAQTKLRGGRVIAVGTTTARSLETAALSGEIKPFFGETDIFIYPGFQFHCVDALITNFHLPASTLLMLVAAFGGYDNVMKAYREAVQASYRFYSYGDGMFIWNSN